MVRQGDIPRDKVSLANVKAWLRAQPEKGRGFIWLNKSCIFFRENAIHNDSGPIGAQGVSLLGGRSLAVDRRHYRLGLPIYLSVPGLRQNGRNNLRRLMIAMDTGTAIKGARRGDIFWGSGDAAGRMAARTYHKGDFYVLLPRAKPLPSRNIIARIRKSSPPAPPAPPAASRHGRQAKTIGKAMRARTIGRPATPAMRGKAPAGTAQPPIATPASIKLTRVKVRRISVEKYLKGDPAPQASENRKQSGAARNGQDEGSDSLASMDFEHTPPDFASFGHEASFGAYGKSKP
jgi:3D (Asp-Asp-Asp) domain-containing protein